MILPGRRVEGARVRGQETAYQVTLRSRESLKM